MSSYTNLYEYLHANLFGNTKPQHSKYKDYLYARAVMGKYCTDCKEGTDIQMPSYTYNPHVSKYPSDRISYPEFLEYEKIIKEYINSFNEFLKTL